MSYVLPQHNMPQKSVLEPRVAVHYGIPSTSSVLAFDPTQHLLAIGTLDGRIKVLGGDNIEGMLISPKPLPFKNLEFLQNQGFLVSISNENEIQVWDLERRHIACNLQWESNITAFSVIGGTHYMYVGDEYGFLSVVKYAAEERKIIHLPYHLPANVIAAYTISLTSGVLLIAYENGLLILWDVTEDRAVLVRGCKDLQLQDETLVVSPNEMRHERSYDTVDDEQAEKEISSLCWVSSDGSVLAVGYVDGDILLWNLSPASFSKDQKAQKSSNIAAKLQLSSGNRRLPVIVLHWSADSAHNGHRGQLFVYGGDDIGSEEVLTILNLDWSSGIETLKCSDRVDLTLHGSFADLMLVPSAAESRDTSSLFVLTNPGQLHFYDDACLSALMSQPDKKHYVHAIQYPAVLPTIEPRMTVASLVSEKGSTARALLEAVSVAKLQVADIRNGESTKWPLTGGVPCQLSLTEEYGIMRLYIAGYQDGSVRIWDATFPVLSLLYYLESQVEGVEVAGATAPVSALDFGSSSMSLAIGNEYGLVRIHRLVGNSNETSLHFVTETNHEVHNLKFGNKTRCTAFFFVINSPVHALQYVTSEARLAVGYECGRVAMLDVSSSSVLFLTDCLSSSSSSVMSLAMKIVPDVNSDSLEHPENKTSHQSAQEVAFIMTKDAHIVVMDCITGNVVASQMMHPKRESTAISLYILGKFIFFTKSKISISEVSEESLTSSQDSEARNDPAQTKNEHERDLREVEYDMSSQAIHLEQKLNDSLILLCAEDALCLYSSKALTQGDDNAIHKMNLVKPCCWTTIFKRNEKECGLILVYQAGVIEIRSLPDLELVGETSLMSILRWNFKTNMDKMMSSSGTGLITMVNGCESAFVSLLAFENDFRIPEALPCLHDEVLAAAVVLPSQNQKKKQIMGSASGILGGIIKGFKRNKSSQEVDIDEGRKSLTLHLEDIFSRFPFSDPSTDVADEGRVEEFNIDDIELEEPLPLPSSSLKSNNDGRDKETERERLFEGGSSVDTKPRLRTPEEIMAKYRKSGDASSAAAHAKDKLVERQDKLERLSKRTEELQSGAENFASMANELVKKMENRKWWNM
ncbi:hypothetical protein RJ639_001154 [Escallonia herrerae]|uniref:V-SNARE coiled-coil homology domain-containing protein n=1 Tax=Escallonia herrerae TaxID=1293975 RepID=A0AA88XAY9_9ASTE|nr:hypothetical protein RJ639_001154 [Escallonia herrerae]